MCTFTSVRYMYVHALIERLKTVVESQGDYVEQYSWILSELQFDVYCLCLLLNEYVL